MPYLENQASIQFAPDHLGFGASESNLTPDFYQRLSYTSQALDDFDQAINSGIAVSSTWPEALATVGHSLIEAGYNPQPVIEELIHVAGKDEMQRFNTLQSVAEIQAHAGEFTEAAQTIARTQHHSEDSKLKIIRYKIAHGEDIAQDLANLEEDICGDPQKGYRSQTSGYSQLAVLTYQSGKDPLPHLHQAEKSAHSPGYLIVVANAYASCGRFEDAFRLLPVIKHNQSKFNVMVHIAQEQLIQGKAKEALETAQVAIEIADGIKTGSDREYSQKIEAAEMRLLMAEASLILGEDPTLHLKDAHRRLLLYYQGDLQVNVISHEAILAAKMNLDPTPLFQTATDISRRIPDTMKNYKVPESYFQLEALTSIINAQAALGYFDQAGQLLNELQTIEGSEVYIPELLAEIAKAKAKKGLKPDELKDVLKRNTQSFPEGNQTDVQLIKTYSDLLIPSTHKTPPSALPRRYDAAALNLFIN